MVGDPTRIAFDLKTSVMTSFLSVLAKLNNFTLIPDAWNIHHHETF